MKSFPIIFLLLILSTASSLYADALTEQKDRISYSIGYQIGTDLKKQDTAVEENSFQKGIEDGLAEKGPGLSKEEMRSILLAMKNKILLAQRRQEVAAAEKYRGEGRDFLEENSKKEGVTTLPSGLQYKIMKEGTGKTPGLNDKVTVHYSGTLIDGAEFINTYKKDKPEEFYVKGVIKGLTEALQLMKEGARWQLFIPADLAYGERGPLADRVVIFDMELISVKAPE